MGSSTPASWVYSLTAALPIEERSQAQLDLVDILHAVARVNQWTPYNTETIVTQIVNSSGNLMMDAAGLHVYNGSGPETIRLASIGDILIGTDLSLPASTHFVFLSTAQTYNSEALGAGDLLIGDNSASKANMLWDASAGILYFRGGTTNQAYINTTGQLTAGAGAVILDSAGISLDTDDEAPNVSKIRWYEDVLTQGTKCADIFGEVAGSGSSYSGRLSLLTYAQADGRTSTIVIGATVTGVSQEARIVLTSEIGSAQSDIEINSLGYDVDTIIKGDTATKLTVHDAGLDAFQIGTTVAGAIADFRAASIVLNEAGADMDFRVESDGNENALFVQGSDGFVGIGTGTPLTNLDIVGANGVMDSRGQLFLRTSDAQAADLGGQISFGGKGTDAGAYNVWAAIAGRKENATSGNTASYLQFGTIVSGGNTITERMRITSAGNVVIGGTTPQANYELTVNDDIYAVGYVSALVFEDRTDYPESLEQAYRAVKSLRGKAGKLDHDKLDPFVKAQDGRNLSALVSAQAEVIKDLIERIDALEAA